MSFDDLHGIIYRYDTARNELELYDDTDQFGDRKKFEIQYFEFKSKFSELIYPEIYTPRSRNSSLQSSWSGNRNHSPRSHGSVTHINLSTIALLTFEGDTCSWLHYRDTFEALVVNKTTCLMFRISNTTLLHSRMKPKI